MRMRCIILTKQERVLYCRTSKQFTNDYKVKEAIAFFINSLSFIFVLEVTKCTKKIVVFVGF